jgi:hypothetical protein
MKTEKYKEIIEEIKEITKTLTIIEGVVDVHLSHSFHEINYYEIKEVSNSFWVIIGNASEDEIKESLEDYSFNDNDVQGEGEYHFNAVLKYDGSDNDHSGYWYIDYIEMNFQQTFLEREREEKLFRLLDDDSDIFS